MRRLCAALVLISSLPALAYDPATAAKPAAAKACRPGELAAQVYENSCATKTKEPCEWILTTLCIPRGSAK